MINFTKMQGAGNDFILLTENEAKKVENLESFIISICDRHFGVGSDGVMIVRESKDCDVFMSYYNSDGSMGEMCGNGLRCFSKYVYVKGIVDKKKFNVETLNGVKVVEIVENDKGKIRGVKVDMGKFIMEPKLIPVMSEEPVVNKKLSILGKEFEINQVLMGVPHTVIFVDELKSEYVKEYGKLIENNSLFPNKTNVNFVKIVDDKTIEVDTWERGAGHTLACGTGACSSAYFANFHGFTGKTVDVKVLGGKLKIELVDDMCFMEGEAKMICDGQYYY